VQLPLDELRGRTVRAQDLMSSAVYERDGDELFRRGIYIEMPESEYHVSNRETL
jgi:hypothetical protein